MKTIMHYLRAKRIPILLMLMMSMLYTQSLFSQYYLGDQIDATASVSYLFGGTAAFDKYCDCPDNYVATGYQTQSSNYTCNQNNVTVPYVRTLTLLCHELNEDGTLGQAISMTCTNGSGAGATMDSVNIQNESRAMVALHSRTSNPGCFFDAPINFFGKSYSIPEINPLEPNGLASDMDNAGGSENGIPFIIKQITVPDGHVVTGMGTHLPPPIAIDDPTRITAFSLRYRKVCGPINVSNFDDFKLALQDYNDGGCNRTIHLTNNLIANSAPEALTNEIDTLRINGHGFQLTGLGLYQLMDIDLNTDVVIDSLLFINGYSGSNGGAMVNQGRLTLTNCSFENNNSNSDGGAIYQRLGHLDIKDCRFINNKTGRFGGAINLSSASEAVIKGSLFSDNQSAFGGALQSDGVQGVNNLISINSSTFINNQASITGGAIDLYHSTSEISNSTISQNSSNSGGGMHMAYGSVSLNHVTITENMADFGSGIYSIEPDLFLGEIEIVMANSIVAGNVGTGLDLELESENYNPYNLNNGHNIIGQVTSIISNNPGNDNVLDITDPKLDPLLLINDLIQIHIPQVSSLAIDAIPTPCSSCSDGDQRSIMRPLGLAYDIGAIEYDGPCLSQEIWNISNVQELNEAIQCFNQFPSHKTINLNNNIVLDESILAIKSVGGALTINGNGFTIDGDSVYQIFTIEEATGLSPQPPIQINNLHLINGFDEFGQGGAINNKSDLALNDSSVSDCQAGTGGGIFNLGRMNVRACTFYDNQSVGPGGAMYNQGILDCRNSTFSQNRAENLGGGAIFTESDLNLIHVTITDNYVQNDLNGEGIFVSSQAEGVTIFGSYIAGNGTADITLENEINVFFGNDNIFGNLNFTFSGNNNLIHDPGNSFLPIADNGGLTQTIELLPNSPAINHVKGSYAITDQRGEPRSSCGSADAGAFELTTGLPRLHIDLDAIGTNSGENWTNALNDLQQGLVYYQQGCTDTLWVAEGTYSPSKEIDGTDDSPRKYSFLLDKNIYLLGGFNGTENKAEQRKPWAHKTVLSGNLGQDGNTYHVLRVQPDSISSIDNSTLIDGFCIQGGFADGSELDSLGGGILILDATPRLSNLVFSNNYAFQGAALYDLKVIEANDGTHIYNTLAYNNQSEKAIYGFGSFGQQVSHTISHTTISDNDITDQATGAIVLLDSPHSSQSSLRLDNTIVWEPSEKPVKAINALGTVSYSILSGNDCPTIDNVQCGTNVHIGTDPQFEDAANNDYQLLSHSIAIDAGMFMDTSQVDLAGVRRNCIPDIGAFERIKDQLGTKLFVDIDAMGTSDGQSWANAYTSLQDAIDFARIECIDTIWIAEGIYVPSKEKDGSINNLREFTFFIDSDIKIFGGFVGAETKLEERDWRTHQTILSGNVGDLNSDTDNSYHVLYTQNVTSKLRLDGIHITEGRADGTGQNSRGGAWVMDGKNSETSPTIVQCEFYDNKATFGGAVYIDGELGVASPIFTGCKFFNNQATIDGGAVFSWAFAGECHPQFLNSVFYDNTAVDDGAAILIYVQFGESNPIIEYCTFHNNQANDDDEGGAVSIDCTAGTCLLTVDRNIFWGNSSSIFNEHSIIRFRENIVQEASCPVGVTLCSSNLFNADPQFMDSDLHDYRLANCSAAIGLASQLGEGTQPIDIDGNPRPDRYSDSGAFESDSPVVADNYAGLNALSGIVETSTEYIASGSIESTELIQRVNDPVHVIYNSTSSISFLPNFEIKTDATMETLSTGCDQ